LRMPYDAALAINSAPYP